jgi:helicase required for RNAi-mediated heterochromatin assembly 1
MSLEQNLLRMGAEPTEMLMASLKQRNARQLSRPAQVLPPSLPKQPQTQGARGRKGKKSARKITTAEAAQRAAQWGQFTENIGRHDEQLHLEALSTAGQPASAMVIQDVYQPTALVNRQRAGGGAKMVQQLQLTYNQVAAGLTNGQAANGHSLLTDLQVGIADLSLATGSPRQAHGVQPRNRSQGSLHMPTTASRMPSPDNGVNGGAKTSQKSPIKAAGKAQYLAVLETLVEQPSIQEAPVHHLPVRQPPVQQPFIQPTPAHTTLAQQAPIPPFIDLLGDDLIDIDKFNEDFGAEPDYLVTPHLLAQFAPLVAPPGFSVRNGTSTQRVLSPAALVQLDHEEQEDGGGDEKEEEEEEEELLIEL